MINYWITNTISKTAAAVFPGPGYQVDTKTWSVSIRRMKWVDSLKQGLVSLGQT